MKKRQDLMMKHTVTFVALFALATLVFSTSAFAGSLAEPVDETTSIAPEVYVAPLSLGGDWTGFYGGYDLGRTLVYATAGLARVDTSLGTNNGQFSGLGVAYQLTDQFVVGGEVLTHQFDDINGSGVDADATSINLRASFRFKIKGQGGSNLLVHICVYQRPDAPPPPERPPPNQLLPAFVR